MSGGDRPKVLVAAIGNPDRGDDGVGPAVAQHLYARVPAAVSVIELSGDVLALIEGWEGFQSVIVVDAVASITAPGRIHRRDLVRNPLSADLAPPSTHAFGLAETVELARSLGRLPPLVVAYLVEGAQFEAGAPLSPTVGTTVEEVAERILTEITAISGGRSDHA
jgi:hydrogenase maturation protease